MSRNRVHPEKYWARTIMFLLTAHQGTVIRIYFFTLAAAPRLCFELKNIFSS
jgi:hypothetical protein